MRRMRSCAVGAAAVCFALLSTLSYAEDEMVTQVNEAMQLYRQGKFSEAASELELAAQQIREKQGDRLKDVFPAPLAGWSAAEDEGSPGQAMYGGGISLARAYVKKPGKGQEDAGEQPSVRVAVIKDSPMLSSVMAVFSNPAFMTGSGGKTVKVASYRGVLKKESSDLDLQLVVGNKTLVTVHGENGASEADVMAYAKALKFAVIEELSR